MTAPPPVDTSAAALTQGHEMSAQRLLRRYRNLLWLTVAPVFVLLVLLAQWQGLSQYTRALDSAAADARAHSAAIDAVVAGASDHVLDMQRWAEKELARAAAVAEPMPDAAIAQAVRPRVQADGSSDGYTLDSLPDFIRRDMAQLLWIDTANPAPTPQALALLQSLSAVMDMAHLRNPDLAWSYLFGWPNKYVALYPWMPSRDMAEALGQPSLRASMDVWYGYGLFTGGVPERNSAHLPYWSAPYVDADSYGLMVSRAAPLYHGGEFRGVVGADLKLEALERLLQRMPGAPWQAWIVDDAGRVVADRARPVAEGPASVAARIAAGAAAGAAAGGAAAAAADMATGSASAPGTGARSGVARPATVAVPAARASGAAQAASGASFAIPRVQRLADRLPAGVRSSDIAAAAAADGRPQKIDGHQLVALRSPGSPWTLVLMAPTTALWLDVLPLVLPYLLIAAVLLMVLLIGQSMLQRRIIVPALGVMGYLQQLAQDDRAPEPYLGPRWQPWVLTVTQTFRSLRESLQREQRSEAFKTAVVDHALAAIVTTDAEGHVVEWNPAATAMFGFAREQAIGQAVSALIVPPRHRDGHAAGMQRVRHGGEQRITGKRVEMSALRADGSEFPVEMVLSRTQVDGVTHYSAFINDVSERRDAAQQIERQREALRQSEKLTAMGSLLAGVAHELNNPLAIVMGRASLLEEKCEQQPHLKADAVRIREAAERCGRIVRTFLNMARSKPAQRSSVSLNDLARAAADMLGYTYRSHSIELQLALDEDLPPVHADGDQIGQVVLNLLVNAQQALAAFEGERRVRLSTGVDGGDPGHAGPVREPRVWLRVADSALA